MDDARYKSDWRPRMSESSDVHNNGESREVERGGLRDLVCVYIQNLSLLLQSVSSFCL